MLLTLSEIDQFRPQLADYPDALIALQTLEDCDGDLADAALSLALKANLEPDASEDWLASFAKRYRHIACQSPFRADLNAGAIVGLVNHLTQETSCPSLLAVPIALYVVKSGVDQFCYSLDHSRC
jgi:hypothetical protein